MGRLYLAILSFLLIVLLQESFAKEPFHGLWNINSYSNVIDINEYSAANLSIPHKVDSKDSSDGLMCWAASASNLLIHSGWAVDADGDGKIEPYEDVYHYFLKNYRDKGNTVENALRDYMTNYWDFEAIGISAFSNSWKDYVYKDYALFNDNLLQNIHNFIQKNYGVSLSLGHGHDIIGLAKHSITVWGYFDPIPTGGFPSERPIFHSLYLTDSNDPHYGNIMHKKIFNSYLKWNQNRWYFSNYLDKNYYLVGYFALAPNPVSALHSVPDTYYHDTYRCLSHWSRRNQKEDDNALSR